MRVVVLGAGSLGSLYGAWFADAGHDVLLVGRPAHVAAVRERGLLVRDRTGAERWVQVDASTDPERAGDADVVMVGAKAQDVPALLAAYTGRAGAAFSVQNGARQAEPVVARFGDAAVGCVSMVGGTLDGPGVVSHTFEGVTYLGDLASSAPGTAAAIAAAFPPGTPLDVRPDIVGVLWAKAVLATAVMGTTALTRLAYHHMFVQPGAREVFLDIVTEAASIAAAEGVELIDLPGPMQAGALVRLPRAEALARLAAIGEHMVATGQTNVRVSMLQSIESGRPLEVGAVFRDLVEVADRHSVHVPLLLATTRLLETIDAVNRGGSDGGGR